MVERYENCTVEMFHLSFFFFFCLNLIFLIVLKRDSEHTSRGLSVFSNQSKVPRKILKSSQYNTKSYKSNLFHNK